MTDAVANSQAALAEPSKHPNEHESIPGVPDSENVTSGPVSAFGGSGENLEFDGYRPVRTALTSWRRQINTLWASARLVCMENAPGMIFRKTSATWKDWKCGWSSQICFVKFNATDSKLRLFAMHKVFFARFQTNPEVFSET